MAEYIDRTQIKWYGCDFEGGKACCKNQGDCSKCIHGNCDHDEVMNIPLANVIEREKIKLLGEEHRKFREGITDEKVLIGYNMAIAICNKYLGESEDKK